MENLTAVVISFLRPKYTIDCIKYLRKNYPNIKILVGEQTKSFSNHLLVKTCKKYNAQYIKLPWDCGVGESRNILIENADTDYILIGDDDFLYDEKSIVGRMLTFIENTDFDLVGGRILQDGNIRNYQGFINIYPDHLETKPLKNPDEITRTEPLSGLRYEKCDLVFNYFIIKKNVAQKYKWDKNIKVAYEHHHFFVGLKKAGVKVAFSPDPIVKHKFQNYPLSQQYKYHRMRVADKKYFLESLGLDYTISINGARVEKDD